MAPLIFLETSLQIRRFLLPRPAQNILEQNLFALAPNLCSNHYVWMEFQRTLVADYAHIHQLMLRYNKWSDLLLYLLKGQRAFQARRSVRCTEAVALLLEECDSDWEYGRYLVQEAVNNGLKAHFWANVTRLPDPIVCDLVSNGIKLQSDGSFSIAATCRKERAACHLSTFLPHQQERIRTLIDYLAAHPQAIKQQARIERLLADVLVNPRAALGQSACWMLGDVIIALQIPANTLVWTIDADFAALTQALGLRLYTPTEQP